MTVQPSPEARPLYNLIYEALREHLLDGSFPPGLVFGQSAVARAFRSSRVPAAAALRRLKEEGLLKTFAGDGLLAWSDETKKPLRMEFLDAGLRLPHLVAGGVDVRNYHGRIYPQVEHTIAALLAFGRFLVNETALAGHYGVSRTVAHEVLTRLERTGLIVRESNQRWYAGPLTTDRLRNHFEMRWLLEPQALGQSMDKLDQKIVAQRRAHVVKAAKQRFTALRLERLESEFHVLTVLHCANEQMVDAIRRSQLPLIPTHSTFALTARDDELGRMLNDHLEIYDLILAGRKSAAMSALENHIRRGLNPNIERLRNIGGLPDTLRPPFLTLAD
ncbi:MAG: GntR family transcriptional regulator [Bradyrhizobium sp.]|nr:MAG: GntR family transcriptional regulator [Bradyrhizobium sp.]